MKKQAISAAKTRQDWKPVGGWFVTAGRTAAEWLSLPDENGGNAADGFVDLVDGGCGAEAEAQAGIDDVFR